MYLCVRHRALCKVVAILMRSMGSSCGDRRMYGQHLFSANSGPAPPSCGIYREKAYGTFRSKDF